MARLFMPCLLIFVLLAASLACGAAPPAVPPTPVPEEAMPDEPLSARPLALVIDGRKFLLNDTEVDAQGGIVVPLASPGLKELFAVTGAAFQWYPCSRSVVVFGMGRDERWCIEKSASVCGAGEIPMAAGYVDAEGNGFIPLDSLARLLKCRPFPLKPGLVALKPAVYSITPGGKDAHGTILVRASHKVRFTAVRSGRSLKVTVPSTALCLPAAEMTIGQTRVRVSGGDTLDGAAVLEFTFPPYWSGEAFRPFRDEEIAVALEPAFPVKMGFGRSRIERIEWTCGRDGARLSLEGKSGFQYFWRRDEQSGHLIVEIPRTVQEDGFVPPAPPAESGIRYELSTTSRGLYPVTRLDIALPAGMAGTVSPVEGEPSITLAFGTGNDPGASGEGATLSAPAGVLVVIDAGHGGSDPGACSNGLREKDVNLAVAVRLRKMLETRGLRVVMTRSADEDVKDSFDEAEGELWSRVKIANDCDADLFISLHCNASSNPLPSGTSIHWYKDSDLTVARALAGILGQSIGVGERGIRCNRFYVLRNTRMPAVLVEMAFLTNPRDAFILKSAESQAAIAGRIADGIYRFLTAYYAANPPGRTK